MIDPHIVKLANDYLDLCAAENSPATLIGMHWYIDRHYKTLPLLEEVNEALKQRPNVYVQRINGAIVFSPDGTKRTITSEDLKQADKQYRKEFALALKKLRK